MVSFEEFAKLDLRVAKIVDVRPVEGSDKLYQLRISLGGEERTLAAGLAKHYRPDELMGRRIVVVANLDPRKLRGVESQGMLLAAVSEDGSVVSVVSPDREDVPLGSKVT
jgi:methionine--tRNA ligase beta chain